MTAGLSFWDAVNRIRQRDPRFAPEAYGFVMDALESVMRGLERRRHVSAAELLDGMCVFAGGRYGMMAYTILESWGVSCSRDIGDVVFHLVDAGVLSGQDSDSREDFHKAIDLQRSLEDSYFEADRA